MAIHRITHPLEGFKGELLGIRFTDGKAVIDTEKIVFSQYGATIESVELELERQGCEIRVVGKAGKTEKDAPAPKAPEIPEGPAAVG